MISTRVADFNAFWKYLGTVTIKEYEENDTVVIDSFIGWGI